MAFVRISSLKRASRILKRASKTASQNRMERLGFKIASFLLMARGVEITQMMDQMARLQFLEGYAGKSPGYWTGREFRNFDKALARAYREIASGVGLSDYGNTRKDDLEEDDPPNDMWFQKYNTGFYERPRQVADSILKSNEIGDTDGDDIMQDMMMDAKGGKSIYYLLGERLQDADLSNKLPKDFVNMVSKMVSRRAIDQVRKLQNRAQVGGDFDPNLEQGFAKEFPAMTGERDVIEFWADLMTYRSDPGIMALWNLFAQAWGSLRHARVVNWIIANSDKLAARGVSPYVAAAEQFGISPAQVRQAFQSAADKAAQALQRELKSNPDGVIADALRRVEDIMTVGGSSYMQRLFRTLKSIPKKDTVEEAVGDLKGLKKKLKPWGRVVSILKENPEARSQVIPLWKASKNWPLIKELLDSTNPGMDAPRGITKAIGKKYGLSAAAVRAARNQAIEVALRALKTL